LSGKGIGFLCCWAGDEDIIPQGQMRSLRLSACRDLLFGAEGSDVGIAHAPIGDLVGIIRRRAFDGVYV